MAISEHDFYRQKYTTELKKLLATKSKSKLFTKERYDELMEDLIEIVHDPDNNNNINNDKEHVKILKNYGLIQIRGEQRLILPPQDQEPMKRYVHVEELYDILDNLHRKLKHCSRAQMMEHLKNSFANITMESVVLYYKMCDVCRAKAEKNRSPYFQKKKPDLSKKPLMRWQINIIDMTKKPDNNGNEYILNFQDVDTKFCILKSLKNSEPKTIAKELRRIFGWIGAPHMISSLNKKFTSSIIECLKEIYPNLVILNADLSSSNFDQNQFQQLLETLCNERGETNWSEVLEDLQFKLNTIVSENDQGLNSNEKNITPFERFFGREPQFGVSVDLLLHLQTTNKSIYTESNVSGDNLENFHNGNLSEASTSSRSINSDGNDNDNVEDEGEDEEEEEEEEEEDEEYTLQQELLEEIFEEASDDDDDYDYEEDKEKEVNNPKDRDDDADDEADNSTNVIETSAMKLVRSKKNKVDGADGEIQKQQKKPMNNTMRKSVSFSLQKSKPKIEGGESSPISFRKSQKVIKNR